MCQIRENTAPDHYTFMYLLRILFQTWPLLVLIISLSFIQEVPSRYQVMRVQSVYLNYVPLGMEVTALCRTKLFHFNLNVNQVFIDLALCTAALSC